MVAAILRVIFELRPDQFLAGAIGKNGRPARPVLVRTVYPWAAIVLYRVRVSSEHDYRSAQFVGPIRRVIAGGDQDIIPITAQGGVLPDRSPRVPRRHHGDSGHWRAAVHQVVCVLCSRGVSLW